MLSEQTIRDAATRMAAIAHDPRKIILFGSYARGDADETSDLDLLVVEREIPDRGEEWLRLMEAVRALPVDVDVLLYTEDEFDKRQGWCSTPVYWAVREGKVVYERLA
ncbi:nucleotidyltransferase domain-containing protein [Methylomagnum sp.]